MKTYYKLILMFIASVGLFSHPAFARLGWYPDFDELSKKCDVIIIAEPVGINELPETYILPNIKPEIKVIGVETTFKVITALKGDMKTSEFVLHHYRLPVPSEAKKMISGPGLVTFPFNGERFLMFLNKENDGRFCPASGQIDPNCSIRPIANTLWDYNRGWIFVPNTSNYLPWISAIVLFFILLLCVSIYLRVNKKILTRPLHLTLNRKAVRAGERSRWTNKKINKNKNNQE